MTEKRVTVWVQRFPDRTNLMLQWLDPDTGKRKTKTADTADEKEAEKARADLEYELNHGKYLEASRMTWERFRELFEEEFVATRRPRTQECYAATLDLFEKLCSPARLRSISERTISAFAKAMRQGDKGGMAPGTVKVRLQFLRTALRWAVTQKMLPECPAFPEAKVPKRKPQPVPSESFEKLLDKAPDAQTRAYLLCGWLAGLRRSEAAALEWEATETAPYLDLLRNRIILPAGFVKAVEDQWVPLDPLLRETLLALPRHGPQVFHFVGRGGKVLDARALGHRVRRLAKKAGVKLTMHSLRKGFGCRYAGKVPAQVLQRLMRHANIQITMDYYANIDAAVEEAILGPQRHSLRNSEPETVRKADSGYDATTNGETVNV
jgi:integrase